MIWIFERLRDGVYSVKEFCACSGDDSEGFGDLGSGARCLIDEYLAKSD
jgi:hypothetical protein